MKVIIITRQYCHYNPLYSLAPSKIITSKQRDQPSTYVYVALFILGITTLFIVTATPSTVISFKVVTARQLRIPQISRKMSDTSKTQYKNMKIKFQFVKNWTKFYYIIFWRLYIKSLILLDFFFKWLSIDFKSLSLYSNNLYHYISVIIIKFLSFISDIIIFIIICSF